MDTVHRRSYSSTAPRFPFTLPFATHHGSKLISMSSPVSPVSPTYTTFSAASPVSSSSSASFANEGSPVPEHTFHTMSNPTDGVYTQSSAVPYYTAQGELSYAAEFEYNIMNWSPEGKKQVPRPPPLNLPHHRYNHPHPHQQHHIPSQSLPNDMERFKTLASAYNNPPSAPPQRQQQQGHQVQHQPSPTIHSPVPSHPLQSFQQQSHASQQVALSANSDAIFDVDLDEWHPPSASNLHAQFPPNHSHSQTHSIAMAQVYPNQYTSNTASSAAPTPQRTRQEDLTVYTGTATYSATSMSHPQSASSTHGHQSHIFDLSASVAPSQSSHPTVHLSQSTLMSPLQLTRSVQQRQNNVSYYSPPLVSRQQLSSQEQAIQHHLLLQQQQQHHVYNVDGHPAEISPVDSCGSASPLSAYADMSASIAPAAGCDPRFVYGSQQQQELKGALGMDLGMHVSSWAGERRDSLASVGSAFTTDVDEDAEGDVDAEGEMDEGENVWAMQASSLGMGGIHVTQDGQIPRLADGDEGEDEVPLVDESESDHHSGESEEDGEEDGSGEFVMRSRRRAAAASSSSYPSMYPYPEGRSLRPRASPRYSPYATYPLATNGYTDEQYGSSSQSINRSRRYASASESSSSPPRTLGSNDGLSSANSTTRRRNRPMSSLPIPVPIPNLTKKSRGRHVPTATSLEDLRNAASGAGKKKRKEGDTARPHECQVEGCGKVFARGEHLKRHVRSLHTNEKPFKCKYPGCGKRFSRHDNLGQHQRVHKDYNPPEDAGLPDSDSD